MTETLKTLQEKMEAAALALDFEEAKRCRDMISLIRSGATAKEAGQADLSGLDRQQPGAMGLGTSQQRYSPPPGWKPPPKPDFMTSGPSRDRRQKIRAKMSGEKNDERARDAVRALLASRPAGGTICPSEVARALTCNALWREAMPTVHAAIDRLLNEGAVYLSWKGQPLKERSGPYRVGSQPVDTP